MNLKINFFKLVISIFFVLNLFVFVSGYKVIDDKFLENKILVETKKNEFVRREGELIEELDILAKSKEDLYSNLVYMKSKIVGLKEKINSSVKSFNSAETEKEYYSQKLDFQKKKNKLLMEKRNLLQKQINEKKAAMQKKATTKNVVKRKTRAS